MEICIKVNGRAITEQIEPDLLLIDFFEKSWLLQRKKRLRNGKLRFMHSFNGQHTCSFLFGVGGKS